MSTTGQFNTKSPTIKRLLREATELSNVQTSDYTASPLDSNLFEWHFTIRGPPSTAYETGIYHGRIVLPPTYPLRPPSFRFLTPSGRFEPNREICLSISGHHEESWQPAWGIRTALVAIRAFMEGDAKGQVGGVDASAAVRERLARDSRGWRCPICARTCAEIISGREEELAAAGDAARGASSEEDRVPENLRMGYRDELQDKQGDHNTRQDHPSEAHSDTLTSNVHSGGASQALQPSSTTTTAIAPVTTAPQLRPPAGARQHVAQASHREDSNWLDLLITGIAISLAYLIIRKVVAWSSI